MNILITRPIETADILAEKIKALDALFHPIIFPAIEIKNIQLSNDDQKLLTQIHLFQGIIFISPVAVTKFFNYQKTLPKEIQIFCTGKDTALKIKEYNRREVFYPQAKYNSEALLELEPLSNIKNKHFIICQGKGGNDLIEKTLLSRGAQVKILVLYERCLPSIKPEKLPHINEIDLIICTSAQSMANLMQLFGEGIQNKRFLVSSEKLLGLGRGFGLKYPPMLAKHAGDEAILEALRNMK